MSGIGLDRERAEWVYEDGVMDGAMDGMWYSKVVSNS